MYSSVHTFSYIQYKYTSFSIQSGSTTVRISVKGMGQEKEFTYRRAEEESREKNYEEQGNLERGGGTVIKSIIS